MNLFSCGFCPEVNIDIGLFPVGKCVFDVILVPFDVFGCPCKGGSMNLMMYCLEDVPACLAGVDSVLVEGSA